jgi:hypothetical protein
MYVMRSLLRMVLKQHFFIFVAFERRSRIRHYEHPRKIGRVKIEWKASASGICLWRYFETESKIYIKITNLIRKSIWPAM